MTKEILSALWKALLMGIPLLLIVPLIGLAMRDHVKVAAERAANKNPKDREKAFLIECAGIVTHAGKIWAMAGLVYGLVLIAIYEPGVETWWFHHVLSFFLGQT